jgi:protocatechuate 3,4-dioxygenase beta subunit
MNAAVKAAIASAVLFGLLIAVFFLVFHTTSDTELPRLSQGSELPGERAAIQGEPRGAEVTAPLVQNPISVKAEVLEKGRGTRVLRSRLMVLRQSETDRLGDRVLELAPSGGLFAFQLSPGKYEVIAQAPGYTRARQSITLIKDSPGQSLVFELDRGTSISGRVLTQARTPIAGANVWALRELTAPDAELEEILRKLPDLENLTHEIHAQTVSAADGSYQLDGLEQTWYTVRAAAAGYSPGEVKAPAPSEGVDIILPEGVQYRGLVRDTRGNPIEGAVVQASIEPENGGLFDIILSRSRPPVDEVVTDSGGQFLLTRLGPGLYNFHVEASGYQDHDEIKVRVTAGQNRDKIFTLKPGHVIRGLVRGPRDEPIAGAKVRASQLGGVAHPGTNARVTFDDGSVTTDEQGFFLFDTLAEGSFMLIAWHPDYQSAQRKDVHPSDQEVILKLAHGSRLVGTVTEVGSGAPIRGASISVTDLANLKKDGVSDEEGRYQVSGLGSTRRPVTVYISAPGYARHKRQVNLPENREHEEHFELDLTAVVEGRVVTSNGDPLGGARIEARLAQPDSGGTEQIVGMATSQQDGTFVVQNVEPGLNARLRVKRTAFLETHSQSFDLQPGERVLLPDIVLSLGGEIAGSVVDGEGNPVRGCMVTARHPGQTDMTMGSGAASMETNAKGEFLLRGLQTGMVDLVVKATNFLEVEHRGVQVIEGQRNTGVRIVLELGGRLEGRVVNSEGDPVINAEITVRDLAEGVKELRAASDAQGMFRVTSIRSKDAVELEVKHEDYDVYFNPRVRMSPNEFVVVLKTLGRIGGVVLDPSGNPLPSFTVQPQTLEQQVDPRKRPRAKTFSPSDGRFEYGGLHEGVYTVYIRSPQYSAATLQGVRVVAGEVADIGEVILQDGGLVTGRVVEAGTEIGIAGAQVRVTQGAGFVSGAVGPGEDGGAGRSVQVTAADGSFSFSGLKEGVLTLEVSHNDFVRQRMTGVDLKLVEKSQNLRIELERGGEITGSVADPSGRPRTGMSVYLVSQGGAGRNQTTMTDNGGRFRFSGVASGTYIVKAHKFEPGSQPLVAEQSVQLRSGEVLDVYLEVR